MTRRDPVRREDGGTRHDGTARGWRIVVPLGGAEHSLTEAEATELRDELTTALTPGSEPADPAQPTDDNAPGANRVSDADIERAIGWFRGDHPVNAIARAALVELRDRRAAAATPPATLGVLGDLLVAQNADLTAERDQLRTALRDLVARVKRTGGYASPEEQDVLRAAERALAGEDRRAP